MKHSPYYSYICYIWSKKRIYCLSAATIFTVICLLFQADKMLVAPSGSRWIFPNGITFLIVCQTHTRIKYSPEQMASKCHYSLSSAPLSLCWLLWCEIDLMHGKHLFSSCQPNFHFFKSILASINKEPVCFLFTRWTWATKNDLIFYRQNSTIFVPGKYTSVQKNPYILRINSYVLGRTQEKQWILWLSMSTMTFV